MHRLSAPPHAYGVPGGHAKGANGVDEQRRRPHRRATPVAPAHVDAVPVGERLAVLLGVHLGNHSDGATGRE
jgi:hypothetical protein